jgi:cell division protein ZapE
VTADGLRELYRREAAARGFSQDTAQLAAVERLEDLRTRLIADATRSAAVLPRTMRHLMGRAAAVPQRGLYLWGGVGRGKTWLMDLFYQSLPFPQRRRTHFHRFMHSVHAELALLAQRRSPLELVAGRIARSTRVLCFDELFVSDIADAMILGTLFGALFQRGVTLVATSNVPPQELYRDGLQRQRFLPAIDLLERNMEVLAVDGGVDYRLRYLTQAGIYLEAGAPQTQERLEALFRELADYQSAQRSIEIEGRALPVVQVGGGAVWFEFSALCEGPRSADDYIEIAREYHSVIVANVPLLDESREDPARRFIALVDELYDHSVDLVLSAAAAPQRLYRGTRLRQEFRRTESRLIEMQTTAYLRREHRP